MALPLNGKKRNLTKRDFFDYFALERLRLNQNVVNGVIQDIQHAIPHWQMLMKCSFLSQSMQRKYLDLLDMRCQHLGLRSNP